MPYNQVKLTWAGIQQPVWCMLDIACSRWLVQNTSRHIVFISIAVAHKCLADIQGMGVEINSWMSFKHSMWHVIFLIGKVFQKL